MDIFKILKGENIPFAKECLWSFDNESVVIFSKTSLSLKKTFEIYDDRYQIQKTLNETAVFGYEDLLDKLQNENIAQSVKIISLYTVEYTYIIFTDEDEILISILKSLSSNVGKICELIKTHPIYYNDDYLFFVRGKQISKDLFLATIF